MNLDELVAKPVDHVILKTGYADTWPNVRISGSSVQATWLDGVYAHVGTQVAVAVMTFGDAPPTYVVVGTYTGTQQREGTVTAVGGNIATLEAPTGSGNFVTATYLGSAPTVGNVMRLLWQGPDVTALGVVAGSIAPPTPAPPPPAPAPPPQTGTLTCIANDSATWSNSYGWNSFYGNDVYQGDGSGWGSATVNNGAWFYAGYPRNLAGLVIKGVHFRVPQRNNAGASSSSIQMNIWLHTSDNRPGGDVTRLSGPGGFNIDPAMGAHWIDLPNSWGDALKSGSASGIGLSGSPYAGFFGIGRDGASGQLNIDWSTS